MLPVAKATCDKRVSCSGKIDATGVGIVRQFGTMADCLTRQALQCLNAFKAPGSGHSLATEQDFVAEKIVSEDEAAAEHTPEEYTQYLDPKYAEQLMSESLATSEEPEATPRKGPGSESPEEVASTTLSEH